MSRQEFTPEEIELLRQIQAHQNREPGPEDLAAGAPPQDPYAQRAGQYNTQADELERQAAAPAPQPQGFKERLIVGLRNGMENFGSLGAPGGYYGQEARRQKAAADENAVRIERAKTLRNQAQQQQDLGQRVTTHADQQKIAEGNLAVSQRQENRADRVSRQPKPDNAAPGNASFVRDPDSGLEVPGSRVQLEPKPTTPTGIAAEYEYAVRNGYKGTFTQYQNEDANRKIPPPVKPPNEAGSYQLLTDDQGRVTAAWNPKSDEYKAVPPQAQGARKAAIPAGTNKTVADLDNAYRKIKDLGKAYKPEFVGPAQGRFERSKASGVLSVVPESVPGFKTPEGYGDFAALNADLKNSVIKLITGAQMGKDEATRILAQVPTETDKEEIWSAKYQQTLKNTEYMMNKIKQLSGAEGGGRMSQEPAQQAPPAGGGGSTDRIRAKLGLDPKGP